MQKVLQNESLAYGIWHFVSLQEMHLEPEMELIKGAQ